MKWRKQKQPLRAIPRNSAQRNTDWKPYFRLRLESTYFYKKKNFTEFFSCYIHQMCLFVAIVYILIFMVLNML